jgi:hypothetical protein
VVISSVPHPPELQEWQVMNITHFDKFSIPVQSLILIALSTPLFAIFALAGDLPRGALAGTFLGALLIVVNAQRNNSSLRQLGPPAAILLMAHVPVVVWNPLKGAPFFGGIIQPLALVDGCIDYAFVWSWLKLFKTDK